jgi:hypothetical protein
MAANSEPPERAHALRRRIFTELLPPVMALLERRRCADTLLYGKCAPHEVRGMVAPVSRCLGRIRC